jgi:hypothetical protein
MATRELTPMLKRADEIDAHHPLMAYYCARARARASSVPPLPPLRRVASRRRRRRRLSLTPPARVAQAGCARSNSGWRSRARRARRSCSSPRSRSWSARSPRLGSSTRKWCALLTRLRAMRRRSSRGDPSNPPAASPDVVPTPRYLTPSFPPPHCARRTLRRAATSR